MPKRIRYIILFLLIVVGAGIWGFVATLMGAPSLVVSFGALAIGASVLVYMFKGKPN